MPLYSAGSLTINAGQQSQPPGYQEFPNIPFVPDNITQITNLQSILHKEVGSNGEVFTASVVSIDASTNTAKVGVQRVDGGGNWNGTIVIKVVAVYGVGLPKEVTADGKKRGSQTKSGPKTAAAKTPTPKKPAAKKATPKKAAPKRKP